jgi:hypothetical protein
MSGTATKFKTMIFTKIFFVLIVIAVGPTFGNGVAAAGLRSRTWEEKTTHAIAGLRDLVEKDEKYDILGFLREAGVSHVTASWACPCTGNNGGNNHDDEDEKVCVCECRGADESTGVNGWDPIDGHGGEKVACSLGIGGE